MIVIRSAQFWIFWFVAWVRSLVGVLRELATFGPVSPTGPLLNIASFLLCSVRLSQCRVGPIIVSSESNWFPTEHCKLSGYEK